MAKFTFRIQEQVPTHYGKTEALGAYDSINLQARVWGSSHYFNF
jgi:hypothetical protein